MLKQKVKNYVLSEKPKVEILEDIFNDLFQSSENTILISGGDEPIYLPASIDSDVNKIISTKDYFSSALHEIAHWCVAGAERRKIVDYGYWYEPDGRTEEQQHLFEKAEVKPQALEWLFSVAVGQKFRLSVDNINQPDICASNEFRQNVFLQTLNYLEKGLPVRSEIFIIALLKHFQLKDSSLKPEDFKLEDLY